MLAPARGGRKGKTTFTIHWLFFELGLVSKKKVLFFIIKNGIKTIYVIFT
jgi:hypothetical protein